MSVRPARALRDSTSDHHTSWQAQISLAKQTRRETLRIVRIWYSGQILRTRDRSPSSTFVAVCMCGVYVNVTRLMDFDARRHQRRRRHCRRRQTTTATWCGRRRRMQIVGKTRTHAYYRCRIVRHDATHARGLHNARRISPVRKLYGDTHTMPTERSQVHMLCYLPNQRTVLLSGHARTRGPFWIYMSILKCECVRTPRRECEHSLWMHLLPVAAATAAAAERCYEHACTHSAHRGQHDRARSYVRFPLQKAFICKCTRRWPDGRCDVKMTTCARDEDESSNAHGSA